MNRESEIERTLKTRRVRTAYRKLLMGWLIRVAVLVAFMWVLLSRFYGITMISGNDMFPALRDGDLVIYYRNADYMCQDTVVYRADGAERCGRIEASRGSEISLTSDGHITIDGNIQPVQSRTGLYSETVMHADSEQEYPHVIQKDTFYILGDNREKACDSRDYGDILLEDIAGKVFIVIRRRAI